MQVKVELKPEIGALVRGEWNFEKRSGMGSDLKRFSVTMSEGLK